MQANPRTAAVFERRCWAFMFGCLEYYPCLQLWLATPTFKGVLSGLVCQIPYKRFNLFACEAVQLSEPCPAICTKLPRRAKTTVCRYRVPGRPGKSDFGKGVVVLHAAHRLRHLAPQVGGHGHPM